MFTGIIRHVGTVRSVRDAAGGRRLGVDVGALAEGLTLGDSIALDGACLTVCALTGATADFDVVAETLARTTLGQLRAGARVNLERPLRIGQTLDGHLVQGHVDGVAEVRQVRQDPGRWTLEFAARPELTGAMVEKGSVAVAGVSLTLTAVGADAFAVALIPTTLAETTLGSLRRGDRVNIESDLIGKYVRRFLDRGGGLTLEKLRDAGFA